MAKAITIIGIALSLLGCVILAGAWTFDRINLTRAMQEERLRFEKDLALKEKEIDALREQVRVTERQLQEQSRLEEERRLVEEARRSQQAREEEQALQREQLERQRKSWMKKMSSKNCSSSENKGCLKKTPSAGGRNY